MQDDEPTQPSEAKLDRAEQMSAVQFGAAIEAMYREMGEDRRVAKWAVACIHQGIVTINAHNFWRLEPYLGNLPKTKKAIQAICGNLSRAKRESISAQLTKALTDLNPNLQLSDGSEVPMMAYMASVGARPVVAIWTAQTKQSEQGNLLQEEDSDDSRCRDNSGTAGSSAEAQAGKLGDSEGGNPV